MTTGITHSRPREGVGQGGGGWRDAAGGEGAAGKVTTARQLAEAAGRSRAGRRPLAPQLTLRRPRSPPPAWQVPRERGGRVADPTLTFMVEAETRGAPGQGVLEGKSDAQHN